MAINFGNAFKEFEKKAAALPQMQNEANLQAALARNGDATNATASNTPESRLNASGQVILRCDTVNIEDGVLGP